MPTNPARRNGTAILALIAAIAAAASAAAQSSSGAAAQRVLIYPPANALTPPPPADGLTRADGSVIAPGDLNGRLAAPPTKPSQAQAPAAKDDGILRSAPPSVAVDADGRGAVVSGATIR